MKYLHVILSSRLDKTYYIAKHGMSSKGCYVRIGSSNQPMNYNMIADLYSQRTRNSLSKITSPRKNLSFKQLHIYYQAKDLTLNNKFMENLELLTEDDKLNYIAYLCSDNNGVSIKVAKYAGTNKVNLIENEEYGYCSIIKSIKSVLNKLEIENITRTQITSQERIERKLVDPIALREAIINAFVHNDYTSEVPPVVEIFSDRVQITSYGGLVSGLTMEDFFECRSMPRNLELMRIFKDLDLVEQLGSGMSRILQSYGTDAFKITPDFMIVTFYFDGTVNDKDLLLLKMIADDPHITQSQIANNLCSSLSTIKRRIAQLQSNGLLVRVGSDKTGIWKIKK